MCNMYKRVCRYWNLKEHLGYQHAARSLLYRCLWSLCLAWVSENKFGRTPEELAWRIMLQVMCLLEINLTAQTFPFIPTLFKYVTKTSYWAAGSKLRRLGGVHCTYESTKIMLLCRWFAVSSDYCACEHGRGVSLFLTLWMDGLCLKIFLKY